MLGKSNKEKGDSFEKLMKKALDSAGYEDFLIDIHKTGREIDITAKHKVTGQPIICECKAHEKPIGSGDILKFYSVYDLEYQRNDKFIGLFFSLSGFKSTAFATYNEMTNNIKNRFLLRDADFILSMLRKVNVIASDDKLDFILLSRIKYCLGERYLTCMDGNPYWIQTILTDNKTTHYTILGAKGEEDVQDFLCTEIGLLDPGLRNLTLLNIHAMKKIIIILLDGSSKTLDEIVKTANECKETTVLSLENLIRDNIVEKISDKFCLRKELTTFIDLAKQFLKAEDEPKFFLSPYNDQMLNLHLIDYCENRFKLHFTFETKKALLQMVRVSPSVLFEILFSPINKYVTTDEHMKRLNMPDEEYKKWKESQNCEFIGNLLRLLIEDLWNPFLKDNLLKRNIRGFKTQMGITLAKMDGLYASASGENVVMLFRAAGKIEAGELVSATDYDLYIETGLILLNLGEPERAIKNLDIALTNLKEPSKIKAAWNNKGLALASIGKQDDAIDCYNKAIEIDEKLKEAWYNKGLAFAFKGDFKTARECYLKALEIDPNYSHASDEIKKIDESTTK